MAELDADALLPNDRMQAMVLDGDVSQIHRGAGQRYASEGDVFILEDTAFEVTSVEDRTLGEMDDGDARREGSDSLQAYRERMVRVHGGQFEWDADSDVVRYQFSPQE